MASKDRISYFLQAAVLEKKSKNVPYCLIFSTTLWKT